jgi:hypothetical protein
LVSSIAWTSTVCPSLTRLSPHSTSTTSCTAK